MNKVGKKTIILSSVLFLVILTSSLYVFMPDNVRIDIQKTKTIYSVWIDGSWELGATEYVYLWDGTKKMRASSRELKYETIQHITKITRTAYWKDDIITYDIYTFDATIENVEFVPVNHELQCINCVGKIVSFEYRDLVDVTETISNVESPQSFGNRMKVEWQDGAYYAKIFNQKVASDKFIIKYRPQSDFETYNVRMFDPIFDINGWQVNLTKIKDCNLVYYNKTVNNPYEVELSYTCNTDYFNYTTNPNYAWCYEYLSGNNSYHTIFQHSFTRGNIPTKTVWWNEVYNNYSIIVKNRTVCKDTGVARIIAIKGATVKDWTCDYSAWGECSRQGKSITCDSKYDGNNDGICTSGESCIVINVTNIKQLRDSYSELKDFGVDCYAT